MAQLGEHYQHFTPHFHADRLRMPLHWGDPRAIWTAGMGDLFHDQITDKQIAAMFGVMAACQDHLFIILTKRVKRVFEWHEWILTQWEGLFPSGPPDGPVDANVVLDFVPGEHEEGHHCPTCSGRCRVVGDYFPPPWPLPNVWIFASVSNQAEANERIPWLLRTPAALHGLSIEPLLGEIRLDHMDVEAYAEGMYQINALTGRNTDMARPCRPLPNHIRFVAVGGETGPDARPCDPSWVRSLRDQCVRAGVPFHFKGWGKHIPDVVEHCMSEKQRGKLASDGYIRAEAEDMPKRNFARMLDGRTWDEAPCVEVGR